MDALSQPCPPGFTPHVFARTFRVGRQREAVWAWLSDPATFTDGQVWPFRVEFVAPEGRRSGGFDAGTFTIHHGPLLSFAGVLGEIDAPGYRDLRYLYGSYALSLRLIRPTRLQFWLGEHEGGTSVRLQVDSYVRSWLEGAWTLAQHVFWSGFGATMARQIPRLVPRLVCSERSVRASGRFSQGAGPSPSSARARPGNAG